VPSHRTNLTTRLRSQCRIREQLQLGRSKSRRVRSQMKVKVKRTILIENGTNTALSARMEAM